MKLIKCTLFISGGGVQLASAYIITRLTESYVFLNSTRAVLLFYQINSIFCKVSGGLHQILQDNAAPNP